MGIQSSKNKRTGRQVVSEMKSLARSMETFDYKVTDYKNRLVEYAKQVQELHRELIKLNEHDVYMQDIDKITRIVKNIKNR